MSRVYLTKTSSNEEIGLFERRHEPVFKFAVTRNGRIIFVANNLRDAYIVYNEEVIK